MNTKTNNSENTHIEPIPYQAMLQNIIDFIERKYEPVDRLSDADINLSLKDIYSSIKEFYPGDYTEADIMHALITAGFHYDSFGDLQLYWKMRVKKMSF